MAAGQMVLASQWMTALLLLERCRLQVSWPPSLSRLWNHIALMAHGTLLTTGRTVAPWTQHLPCTRLSLQLWPHIVLMAYGMVLINAAVLAPFILFVLGFSSRGWNWIQGAVLAAMLAPTDAVAGECLRVCCTSLGSNAAGHAWQRRAWRRQHWLAEPSLRWTAVHCTAAPACAAPCTV